MWPIRWAVTYRNLSWLGRWFFAAHAGPGRRFRLAGQIAELAVVAQGLSGDYATSGRNFNLIGVCLEALRLIGKVDNGVSLNVGVISIK